MLNRTILKNIAVLLICIALLLPLSTGRSFAQGFSAHTDVNIGSSSWTYTLYNDETIGSPNFITDFTLKVNAPITVFSSPTGWDFQTDGLTYVYWYDTDSSLPYPDDVAPGASLGGFGIDSTVMTSTALSYTLNAWDHSQDAPGPGANGTVFAPNAPAPVPELSTWQSLGGLLLLGGLLVVRRLHHKRG